MPSKTSTVSQMSKSGWPKGRPRPERRTYPNEQDFRMGKMRESGMLLREIGDRFDITGERVRQRLARFGLDRAIGTRYLRSCLTCGEPIPGGDMSIHRREHHSSSMFAQGGKRAMTVEEEGRQVYIIEAYLRGDRIDDICRTVRTPDDRPLTYMRLYQTLRRVGIKPNRGGGAYKRTDVVRQRSSEAQHRRHTDPVEVERGKRGWRPRE